MPRTRGPSFAADERERSAHGPQTGPDDRRLGRHRRGLRAHLRQPRLRRGPDRPPRRPAGASWPRRSAALRRRGPDRRRRPRRARGARARSWPSSTAHGRAVDALVNNAGYGLPGAYADTRWEDQRAFIQVMMTAPCELAHRVLPGHARPPLRPHRQRRLAGGPGPRRGRRTPSTAPAKAFLVRFSQSLHLETAGTGVHVSALCPGFTYSEFHDVNGTRAQISQRRRPGCGWAPTRWPPPATRRWRPTAPICVPGAPNKAIAALRQADPRRLGHGPDGRPGRAVPQDLSG